MTEIPPELMAALVQAMQKDDGMGALKQELGAYDAMGPQGFKQMTGMGTLDQRGHLARQSAVDQSQALEQQLAQAQALARPKQEQHSSLGGTIGSGIGNIFGSVLGGIKSHRLQEQQQGVLAQGAATQAGLLDQQDAGRLSAGNGRYEALRKYLMAKQMQPQGAAQSDAALLEPLI